MKLHRTLFDIAFAAIVVPSIQRMAKRCYAAGKVEGREEVTQEFVKGGFLPVVQLVGPAHLETVERLLRSLRARDSDEFSRLGAQHINELACRVHAQRLMMEQAQPEHWKI